MEKVKSKYKNPDRYIERLKGEIDTLLMCADDDANTIRAIEKESTRLKRSVLGDYWFTYASGATKAVDFTNKSLGGACALGKKVFIVGKITNFNRSTTDKNSATFELGKVYIKDV